MEQVLSDGDRCNSSNRRELILSHRNLRELDTTSIIAANSDQCIEHLDLSHNRLTKLDWIYKFPHLRCLILDDNRLREAHLEKLKVPLMKITTLTLNKNELSDLGATAKLLETTFPNLQYLSLHGNPMCPDNLYLQPFSEFVPYEYTHYRTILSNSLPHLKFLDHFSLDSFHLHTQTLRQHSKQQKHPEGNDPQTSTSTDLWSKLKKLMTVSDSNDTNVTTLPLSPPRECVRQCAAGTYAGIHSEGNRFITNSDL